MPMVIVKDERAAKRRLASMRQRTEHPEPLWPKVERHLKMTTRRQFASRGAYLGTPWPPLKTEYRRWKVRMGYPRSILVMTGELRSSYEMLHAGDDSMTFGSVNQKAVWHQRGTHRNGKRVNPPRPMLVVNPQLRREIRDIAESYIIGRVRNVGGE